MVCLGIIIDDFRGPHLFYLLQRRAGSFTLWDSRTRLFFFTSFNALMRVSLFSTFLLSVVFNVNSRFFFHFCITLRVYIKLFHVIIIVAYSYQCSSNWSRRVHHYLCLYIFVLYPVYIYQEFDFSERKSSIFT